MVRQDLPDRKGVSKQSWAIFPKVRELDDAIAAYPQLDIRETHPEVVFAAMNGGEAVVASKKSEVGRIARIRLLNASGFAVEPFLTQRPAGCAIDDLIDSFACLWTARRIHERTALAYGDPSQSQIWA